MTPLRSAAEIAGRLELTAASQVLLIDAPDELAAMLEEAATPSQSIRSLESRALRSARDRYDLVLLWQESRIGSQAAVLAAAKKLSPDGRLWVATALRKVQGPHTPAIHRLERSDIERVLAKAAFTCDREARLSAWHTAYRFVRKAPGTIDS